MARARGTAGRCGPETPGNWVTLEGKSTPAPPQDFPDGEPVLRHRGRGTRVRLRRGRRFAFFPLPDKHKERHPWEWRLRHLTLSPRPLFLPLPWPSWSELCCCGSRGSCGTDSKWAGGQEAFCLLHVASDPSQLQGTPRAQRRPCVPPRRAEGECPEPGSEPAGPALHQGQASCRLLALLTARGHLQECHLGRGGRAAWGQCLAHHCSSLSSPAVFTGPRGQTHTQKSCCPPPGCPQLPHSAFGLDS